MFGLGRRTGSTWCSGGGVWVHNMSSLLLVYLSLTFDEILSPVSQLP